MTESNFDQMRKVLAYIFLLLFFAAVPQVHAQSKKQQELEAKRQAILAEIKQINSLLFKTKKEEQSVLSQVEDLNQRISATENLIRVTNQQANLLTRNINENIKKIDALRRELQIMKDDYAEMVRKSYKSKNQQSRIMFLLSSDNFLQAYKRVQYMKQYAAFRKKQGEGIRIKTEELQKLNADLLEQKKTKQKLIAENEVAKKQLHEERKTQQELIATLKKDENKYATQIREKQRESEKIDREIDALIKAAIAEANKKARASNKVTIKPESAGGFALTAEAKALGANFASNKGKLPWPVEKGMVIKSFGRHQHPQFPNVTTNSSGVEIATEEHAPVRAIFDGEVLAIQVIKGANKLIQIQHGNYISVYGNLENVTVSKGQKVSTKQQIGTVAKSAVEGRSLLKFYIYNNQTKINPADWIYRM